MLFSYDYISDKDNLFSARLGPYTKNQVLVRMNHITELFNGHNNHTYSSEYSYSTISFRSFSWI